MSYLGPKEVILLGGGYDEGSEWKPPAVSKEERRNQMPRRIEPTEEARQSEAEIEAELEAASREEQRERSNGTLVSVLAVLILLGLGIWLYAGRPM